MLDNGFRFVGVYDQAIRNETLSCANILFAHRDVLP
jgi:hypothetical protein